MASLSALLTSPLPLAILATQAMQRCKQRCRPFLPPHGSRGVLPVSSPPRKRLLAVTWNRVQVSWRLAVTRVCCGRQRRSSGNGSDRKETGARSPPGLNACDLRQAEPAGLLLATAPFFPSTELLAVGLLS